MKSLFHFVLVEPEIPQNTGNIGRTCVGLGGELHLVGKLGFSLDQKELKRAGLDYWPKLKYTRHETWEIFLKSVPTDAKVFFMSTKGKKNLWDCSIPENSYLIFGSESRGFPPPFYTEYKDKLVRIPHSEKIRSLNLSTAAGMVAYEVLRQNKK